MDETNIPTEDLLRELSKVAQEATPEVAESLHILINETLDIRDEQR